jgi:dinuclear metal center YbgI/SA1388 family protein
MAETQEIIKAMEDFAPIELCPDWDNSGWQINLGHDKTKKIMLALSVYPEIIEQAVKNNCEMIISHHPLLFAGIKNLDSSSLVNKTIIKAVQNNIQIYSAHINLDKTTNGIAETLCKMLKLKNVQSFEEEYVKTGNLETVKNLDDFVLELKLSLNVPKIKLINPSEIKNIKRVALCPGGGSDFIPKLKDIDVFVTGDVKYHSTLEVNNFAVIDAGHFETERIIFPSLQKMLVEKCGVEVIIAKEKAPWIFI